MLRGKTVLLGVTGGIAAYKTANLASMLKKQHADVHVIMTKNACEFITPITFETLTGNKCIIDTFDRNFTFEVGHVSLAKKADILVIAPMTANVGAKLAYGIADDMLTTTALACACPKLAAPAMNTRMYENAVTQDNLASLARYGWTLIEPDSGRLACGDSGKGKMACEQTILEYILKEIACPKDMAGLNVLVTAGPTRESVDPVRYITNRSSGKMGYALAYAAMLRGAEVTLVSGQVNLEPVPFVRMVSVESARDMFEAVTSVSSGQDIIVKAAAVADYRPKTVSEEKMKKDGENISLELERTDDILKYLGENRTAGQYLCGFSMETQNTEQNSARKLQSKNIDMIAANSLREEGAGFGTDTNVLTVITKKHMVRLELMSKKRAAFTLFDIILNERKMLGID